MHGRRTGSALSRRMARGARLAGVVLVAALLCRVGGTARADDVVIPAGREAEVIKVIAPYGLTDEVAEGFRIKDIRIGQSRIDVVLAHEAEPKERVTFAVAVRPESFASDLSVDPPDDQQSPSA